MTATDIKLNVNSKSGLSAIQNKLINKKDNKEEDLNIVRGAENYKQNKTTKPPIKDKIKTVIVPDKNKIITQDE